MRQPVDKFALRCREMQRRTAKNKGAYKRDEMGDENKGGTAKREGLGEIEEMKCCKIFDFP